MPSRLRINKGNPVMDIRDELRQAETIYARRAREIVY